MGNILAYCGLFNFFFRKEVKDNTITLQQLEEGMKELNPKVIDSLSEQFAMMECPALSNKDLEESEETNKENTESVHRSRALRMCSTLLERKDESEPLNVIDLLVTIKAKEQNLNSLADELAKASHKQQELEKTISKQQKLKIANEQSARDVEVELTEFKKKNKLLANEIQVNKKETVEIFKENQLLQEQIDFAKEKIQELLLDQSKTYEESLIKYQNTLQLVNRLKSESEQVTNEKIASIEQENASLKSEVEDLRQTQLQKQTFIEKLLNANIYKMNNLVNQNAENISPTSINSRAASPKQFRKNSLNSRHFPKKQNKTRPLKLRSDSLPFAELPSNYVEYIL